MERPIARSTVGSKIEALEKFWRVFVIATKNSNLVSYKDPTLYDNSNPLGLQTSQFTSIPQIFVNTSLRLPKVSSSSVEGSFQKNSNNASRMSPILLQQWLHVSFSKASIASTIGLLKTMSSSIGIQIRLLWKCSKYDYPKTNLDMLQMDFSKSSKNLLQVYISYDRSIVNIFSED